MYHVSAQGVDERMINVHYYYYYICSDVKYEYTCQDVDRISPLHVSRCWQSSQGGMLMPRCRQWLMFTCLGVDHDDLLVLHLQQLTVFLYLHMTVQKLTMVDVYIHHVCLGGGFLHVPLLILGDLCMCRCWWWMMCTCAGIDSGESLNSCAGVDRGRCLHVRVLTVVNFYILVQALTGVGIYMSRC